MPGLLMRLQLPKPSSNYDLRIKQVIAGACAGAVTKTAVAPLERLKVLYQLQGMNPQIAPKYITIPQSLRLIVAEEGLRGWYKGNGANVLRVIPTYALKFTFNDTFKDMIREPGQVNLTFKQGMIAGSFAGLFQTTITYPLDLVRTRLSMAVGAVKYKGIVDCAVKIAKTEGISSWYKGFGPTLASATPYVALQMTFYDMVKRNLSPVIGDNIFEKVLSGAVAGMLAQTITFPGDVIRRRMQTQGIGGAERQFKNTIECIKSTAKHEGVRGFFKGLSVNLIRCLPGAGIQFAAYDTFKYILNV